MTRVFAARLIPIKIHLELYCHYIFITVKTQIMNFSVRKITTDKKNTESTINIGYQPH